MRPVYRILLLIAALTAVFVVWHWRGPQPVTFVDALLPDRAADQGATLTFAVIGDNEGSNPTYDTLIEQIAADKRVQFVLHVGDATPTGATHEHEELQALHQRLGLRIPVYMVPGNHDIIDERATAAWSTLVGARWRSVNVGNLHLVLLDNADRKVGFPDPALQWLEQDLQSRAPGVTTILAYHRPFAYPLANLLGDDETRTSRASNERFLAILAANPVDHVFTGHIHTAIDYPMVLARDANDRVTKSVPVTVSGGGGQPIQTAFGGLLKEKYHALRVTVEGGKVTTEFILPKN